jgi:Ran GTPase-activating protein (RanGAP) involved in mRNA processing and transport
VDAIDGVKEFITSAQKPTKLKTFHVWNNLLNDAGGISVASLIKDSSSLQDLRISSTRISSDGCLAICESLTVRTLTGFLRLDLSDNNCQKAAPILATFLSAQKSLKSLNLGDTIIGNTGTIGILKAIQPLTELESLNLSGNDLTAKCVESLNAALLNKSKLKSLVLADNEIGDAGLQKLSVSFKQGQLQSLEELDLCHNEVKSKGALALVSALLETDRSRSFKSLLLNGNAIDSESIEQLRSKIKNAHLADSVLGSLDENEDEDADD